MSTGGNRAGLARVELDGAAGAPATPEALTLGERGAEARDDTPPTGALEPITQGIGRLMVALSELVNSPATTGTLRIGALELEYQALHRAYGSVRMRWRTDSPATDVAQLSDAGSPEARSRTRTGGFEDAARAWERGVAAAHEGEHSRALRLYEQEAEAAAGEGAHGRAAIAYRSASGQAERSGRHDEANRLLRLAGKHYLCVAETPDTPPRGIRQAYEVAAKCFLQAGNLELASTSISRAMALDEALGTS